MADGAGAGAPSAGKLRHAMICAANVNRSMAAHALLKQQGLNVSSFGAGRRVKLPGPSQDQPNVYEFGQVTYQQIMDDLCAKDEELYARNGLVAMLQRNIGVKPAPQRWQDHRDDVYDVAITFETRVMEIVVEDMNSRDQSLMRPLLVVNMDVKDNHAEAASAAPHALRLCQLVEGAEDWEAEIDEVLERFAAETGRRPTYSIVWY